MELVDHGFEMDQVNPTDLYELPESLWTEFGLQATVNLHIPQVNTIYR